MKYVEFYNKDKEEICASAYYVDGRMSVSTITSEILEGYHNVPKGAHYVRVFDTKTNMNDKNNKCISSYISVYGTKR